jgi:HSP20 family protein
MLVGANVRHFTQKKELSRLSRPPTLSIRPSRKSLWQWDPFIDEYSFLHPFQVEMEKHLGELHNKFGQYFGENEFPACSTDIKENNDNYEIHVDLPGVKKEDIGLSIKDNVLTISGERKYEHSEGQPMEKEKGKADQEKREETQYYRKERYHGKFVRSISLPENIDEDPSKIMATYHDGVLNVSVPKRSVDASSADGKRIDIL